jgi:hypothetical protein
MAQEQLQQQELGAREREHALAPPCLVRAQVEPQVGIRERLLLAVALAGTAQQRAHAREQLAQRERLDQVVVGAHVQAGDAVVDLAARGEHQHRCVVAALAQAPAHLQPVHARHRDVEDDRLVRGAPQLLERLVSVAGLGHVVVFQRQCSEQRILHGGLVVDDQYACLLGHDWCAQYPPGTGAGAMIDVKGVAMRLA